MLLGTMRAPKVDVLTAIFQQWSEIAGPALADHCQPVSVEGDRLTVRVSDPAHASEVRWLQTHLLARVADVSGTARITRLAVRVQCR